MKSSMVFVVLALWVSAVWSSQGIRPPPKPATSSPYYPVPTPTTTSSYYQTQYTQDRVTDQVRQTGAQVSVQSKITAPQTGPIVQFSQTSYGQQKVPTPTVNINYQKETTYQRPVVHQNEQHFVPGSNVRITEQSQHGSYQYGGSVTTTQYGGQNQKYNQKTVTATQCRRPKAIPNFNWDLTVTKGTWYFPLTHNVDLKHVNEITYGRELRSNDNINELCLRNDWTVEAFAKFYGRNDITSGDIECKTIENGAGTECVLTDANKAKTVTFYGVKSDNKNYLLVSSCWSDGENGWMLFSLTPKISYSLKQEIYAEVRTLGFDVADALEVSYDTCQEQQQSVVKTTYGATHTYETKVKETVNHFGQRPATTVFTQTQHSVVQPAQQYGSGQKTTVYQPVQQVQKEVVTKYSNCKVPSDYKLAEVTWRSDNTDSFYYPLIHENDLTNYYKIVFGRGLRSNEDTNSQCLHNHWSVRNRGISSVDSSVNTVNDLVYTIVGVDKTSEAVNCQQIGNKWAYECTPAQGDTFRTYTVKTDNEKYALAYTCWESGTTGWTLYSDTPTVSATVKKDILKQVETLGFGKYDVVFELKYDTCNNVLPKVQETHQFASGQKTVYQQENRYVAQKEQEKFVSSGVVSKYGHCKEPSHYQLVDFKWDSDKDLYYYPLIHQNDFNNFYKILFGQDFSSQVELDSVCLNTRWSFDSPSTVVNNHVNIVSFDKISEPLNCKQIGTKFAYECTNDLGDSYRMYVLKTDQKSWYLAYTCWESGTTGWTVYSQTPKITYQTQQEVLRLVKTLGFESDDYLEINYDQCTHDKVQTTFTSTVKETKPAIYQPTQTYTPKIPQTTYSQQRETTTFVQKPVVHQHTTTFGQKPVVNQQTTTFVQKPVVQQTTTFGQKPVVQQNAFVQKPFVQQQTTTFGQRPVVQQTAFVQKPFVQQQTTTFGQKPVVQQTAFVQKPFVQQQTTTFVQKPVVQQTAFVQKPFVQQQTTTFTQRQPVIQEQTTTFGQKPVVHQQTTTFGQKPVVHQQTTTFTQQQPYIDERTTTTFGQKPVVQTTFTQRQPVVQQQTTTFTQRQPVQQQTTFNQKQTTFGSYSSGQIVYSGIRATKYQHCSIPPLAEIADSPLSATVGVKNQAELTLQEQYFYFPLSQRTTLNSVNKFVFGKDLNTNDKVNSLCYGSKFSWTGKDKDILITFYSKGLNNNRSSEEIVCRQEDSTKWLGECVASNGETFLAYVVREDYKEGEANGFIGNFCWESGKTSWNFFSTEKTVSSEDKEIVLREVGRLGYSSDDYVELSYAQCPKDSWEQLLQTQFFIRKAGSQTNKYNKFPNVAQRPFSCKNEPKDFLKRYTFESSTFSEGVEYFDIVMMHDEEPELLNQLINYKKTFNLRQNKDSTCYRLRVDHGDNGSQKFIGFRDVVSDDIHCTQYGKVYQFNCASKVTGDSFVSYGIKSDSSTWELLYKCWESGKETWDVRAKAGTILSENIKSNILTEVEKLGFNPAEYVEFDHDKCEFNNNLFSGYESSCDCCKVKKLF